MSTLYLYTQVYGLCCRREQWPLISTYSCWQQLVTQTKNLSKDHAALSEIYSTHLVSRLSQVIEDVQRIYRRVSLISIDVLMYSFSFSWLQYSVHMQGVHMDHSFEIQASVIFWCSCGSVDNILPAEEILYVICRHQIDMCYHQCGGSIVD